VLGKKKRGSSSLPPPSTFAATESCHPSTRLVLLLQLERETPMRNGREVPLSFLLNSRLQTPLNFPPPTPSSAALSPWGTALPASSSLRCLCSRQAASDARLAASAREAALWREIRRHA
jgi:hypothetical protein